MRGRPLTIATLENNIDTSQLDFGSDIAPMPISTRNGKAKPKKKAAVHNILPRSGGKTFTRYLKFKLSDPRSFWRRIEPQKTKAPLRWHLVLGLWVRCSGWLEPWGTIRQVQRFPAAHGKRVSRRLERSNPGVALGGFEQAESIARRQYRECLGIALESLPSLVDRPILPA